MKLFAHISNISSNQPNSYWTQKDTTWLLWNNSKCQANILKQLIYEFSIFLLEHLGFQHHMLRKWSWEGGSSRLILSNFFWVLCYHFRIGLSRFILLHFFFLVLFFEPFLGLYYLAEPMPIMTIWDLEQQLPTILAMSVRYRLLVILVECLGFAFQSFECLD